MLKCRVFVPSEVRSGSCNIDYKKVNEYLINAQDALTRTLYLVFEWISHLNII